jgi:hypothetical protein
MNGRYTREQCCGRELELADRGGLPFTLNESRNESLDGSEHHLSNLLVGRPMRASSASDLHEAPPPSRAAIDARWHSRAFKTTGLRNFNIGCQSQSRTVRLPSTPLFLEDVSRFNVGIMPEAAKVYFRGISRRITQL